MVVRDAVVGVGPGFRVAFANEAQAVFLDGHVLAFEYFGGAPDRVRYDNFKPAVVREGRSRVGRRPNGSSRCGRITGSTRSSATRA